MEAIMENSRLQEFGRTSRNGGFIVGAMYGIALGGVLGLLFAPKRGSELRRQVADSADRVRRQANDLYGTASDTVNEVVRRGRRACEAGTDAFKREASRTTAGRSGIMARTPTTRTDQGSDTAYL